MSVLVWDFRVQDQSLDRKIAEAESLPLQLLREPRLIPLHGGSLGRGLTEASAPRGQLRHSGRPQSSQVFPLFPPSAAFTSVLVMIILFLDTLVSLEKEIGLRIPSSREQTGRAIVLASLEFWTAVLPKCRLALPSHQRSPR